MTLFQSLIFAVVEAFSAFLPVGSSAHRWALGYFTGWDLPSGPLLGAILAGLLLGILIMLRHDVLSLIASFLRVVLTFQRPTSLDERMPFFLILSAIPPALLFFLHGKPISLLRVSPAWVGGALIAFSIPFWLAQSVNRQTKNFTNWNWIDATLVGLTQMLALVPGAGRMLGALTGAMVRNFQREAAAKFAILSFAPVLIFDALYEFRDLTLGTSEPMLGVTWLTFWMSMAVAALTSCMAIGGFTHSFVRNGVRGFTIWRMLLGVAIVTVSFLR